MVESLSTGDSIRAATARWQFNGDVADHFTQHARRSIPHYEEGHDLVLKIADFFLEEGSTCYDLGCSDGALLDKLARRNADRRVKLIGIDCEEDMIKQARERCQKQENIVLACDDLAELTLETSDLIVAYYTMQFVRPKVRQLIFDRIFQSLNWGGGFLLFEKVRSPDARFQDMMSSLYADFKLENGYSPEEIVNKSRSLRGVLEPFSTEGNLDLLRRAGFSDIQTISKYLCFEGFLAIK